jgi:Methyltransferase domain
LLMISVGEKRVAALLPGTGSGTELDYPTRIVAFPSWLGHTPFAQWLIGALKPRLVVELGVHTGNSYCAFLQAVHTLGLDTRCFGIDHWQGDEHAGFYGDEVYHELRAYHDARYGTFSTLLRSSFEAALSYFADGSVDLLHIDGFHTYEAVSSDFTAWLPKLSTRGVVLFHDTNVRERGFGIWQFWEELTSRYPHFEFLHSHGLGVAYLGTEPLTGPLKELFAARTDADREGVRNYFARLGTSVIERFATQTLAAEVAKAKGQVSALQANLKAARSKLAYFDETKAQIAVLKAELAEVRSKLVLEKAAAEALASELRVKYVASTLQADIKTSVVRQRMAVTARLQRELIQANLNQRSYQRQLQEVLQSRSWRLMEPMRRVVTKLRNLFPSNRESLGSSRAVVSKS